MTALACIMITKLGHGGSLTQLIDHGGQIAILIRTSISNAAPILRRLSYSESLIM
jgi:hypothetical protein